MQILKGYLKLHITRLSSSRARRRSNPRRHRGCCALVLIARLQFRRGELVLIACTNLKRRFANLAVKRVAPVRCKALDPVRGHLTVTDDASTTRVAGQLEATG